MNLFEQVKIMRNPLEKPTPPSRAAPRRSRRQREREQLRQMKRTADGSNIEVNQKRKRFHKACF